VTSETRVDALTGTPVIMATHRQDRPNLPVSGCPFCVGGLEAPEPYDVRWFANRWPTLGEGRAEVVLFSPDHDQSLGGLGPERVRRVVDLWAARTVELGSREDVDYVLVFENRGAEVGATIPHPHGQIYAFGEVPPIPARELDLADERGSCALCDEEPGARVVSEHGGWRAWVPHASGHPYGMILASGAHLGSLVDLDDAGRDDLSVVLGDALARLDRRFDEPTPYLLWVHQRPTDGGDWPLAHVHIEIVPFRRAPGVNRYVASAELGSGTLINSVDPVDAARALRDA
jgi:UDPglucose--hexose-1-phosphate uridylyltransferase